MSAVRTASEAPQRSSLTQNVVAMYALQIANYLIPLVTLPYLIRSLGAEQYGVVAMAYAVVYFMVLFVDAGINTLAARRLARPDVDGRTVAGIFAATQLIKLVQSAAMFLLLCCLVLTVPGLRAAAVVYLATFPIVLGSLLFPTWLFQGLEIMRFTTLCSVGGRLLATAGIFMFVRDPGDVVLAALLQASATALSGLLALPVIFGRLGLRLRLPKRRLLVELRRTLSRARSLAPAEYLSDALGNSGVFILGLFAGDAAVGAYAAVEKVARAAASLFQPLKRALFPALAGRWMRNSAAAGEYCRSWTLRIVLLGGIGATGLFFTAPLALDLMFGRGWSEHATLLQVLAVWLALHVAATALGQFWLLARGERSLYTRCLIRAGTVQLAATFAGAWAFGPPGLVTAVACAELLRLALFSSAVRSNRSKALACAS